MNLTVDVTQEDINHGERGNCNSCPVARAIQRASGHECRAGGSQITIKPENGRNLYLVTPEAAWRFMYDFDMGRKVEPFSFTLRLY